MVVIQLWFQFSVGNAESSTSQKSVYIEPMSNETVVVGQDTTLKFVVIHPTATIMYAQDNKVAFIHIDRQMILTIHTQVITLIPHYSIHYDNKWFLKIQKLCLSQM